MPNIGLVPIPDTPVGIVRALIGDTAYIPLDPAVTGYGDYAQFSDVELAAFLLNGADSPLHAAGHAYYRLAANATFESRNIAQDDLRINTEKRATDFRLLGDAMFKRADAADEAANSGNDFFDIVGFNPRPSTPLFAEFCPPVLQRSYTTPETTPTTPTDPDVPFGLHEDPQNPGYYIP